LEIHSYWAEWFEPRPESRREDEATAAEAAAAAPPGAEVAARRRAWHALATAAESGWDFSSRWLGDGATLATIRTAEASARAAAAAAVASPCPRLLGGLAQASPACRFAGLPFGGLAHHLTATAQAWALLPPKKLMACSPHLPEQVVPADLNAFVFQLLSNISWAAAELGDAATARRFGAAAAAKREAVAQTLWDAAAGCWRDGLLSPEEEGGAGGSGSVTSSAGSGGGAVLSVALSRAAFASNYVPLWTGLTAGNPEMGARVVASLEASGLVQPGGGRGVCSGGVAAGGGRGCSAGHAKPKPWLSACQAAPKPLESRAKAA
jgi:hypothetical protein